MFLELRIVTKYMGMDQEFPMIVLQMVPEWRSHTQLPEHTKEIARLLVFQMREQNLQNRLEVKY